MSAQQGRVVTTLCGSRRFPEALTLANLHLSARGRIVLDLAPHHRGIGAERSLDDLHRRKIDLSHTVFVCNVGGYVGPSVKAEVEYAIAAGKKIEWLFPDAVPAEYEEG